MADLLSASAALVVFGLASAWLGWLGRSREQREVHDQLLRAAGVRLPAHGRLPHHVPGSVR